MNLYAQHLLDGIDATTESYAFADTYTKADRAIGSQARFLVELAGQTDENGDLFDIEAIDGTIATAVEMAAAAVAALVAVDS